MRKRFITSAEIDLRFSSYVPTGFYGKRKHILSSIQSLKQENLKICVFWAIIMYWLVRNVEWGEGENDERFSDSSDYIWRDIIIILILERPSNNVHPSLNCA